MRLRSSFRCGLKTFEKKCVKKNMLVAPNANGTAIVPPGALPATFSQTSTAVGSYLERLRSSKATWAKADQPPGKVVGHSTCTGYMRLETHPIVSKNRTTSALFPTRLTRAPTDEGQTARDVCLEVPEPVLGDFGVGPGAPDGFLLGGQRLIATLGDSVMFVGRDSTTKDAFRIRVLSSITWVVTSELIVPLYFKGIPFSNTMTVGDDSVVFVPGEYDRFGVYTLSTNEFRFSSMGIRDILDLPHESGLMYDQGFPMSGSSATLVFPGLFSGVTGETLRPAVSFDVLSDTISIVPALDVLGPLSAAYRTPIAVGGKVVLASGTSACLIISFWNAKAPLDPPVSFKCSSELVRAQSGFLKSSVLKGGMIVYSPYPGLSEKDGEQIFVWTTLDPDSSQLLQVIQKNPLPYSGAPPQSTTIVDECDDHVAVLFAEVTPPWMARLDLRTFQSTSVRLDLPPCVSLDPLTKVVITQNQLIVPGGSVLTGNLSLTTNIGLNFYVKTVGKAKREISQKDLASIPIATDKVTYSKTRDRNCFPMTKGMALVMGRAPYVEILPSDNGQGKGCISSNALRSRVVKSDTTDWRTLQTRLPRYYNRELDPRRHLNA